MRFYFSSPEVLNQAYQALIDMAREVARRRPEEARPLSDPELFKLLDKNPSLFSKDEYRKWEKTINGKTRLIRGHHRYWNNLTRNVARFGLLYEALSSYDRLDGRRDQQINFAGIRQFSIDLRRERVPGHVGPVGRRVWEGEASYYVDEGKITASGTIFHRNEMSIAHRTLPLGTIVRIHAGGRSVVAMVTDRGPFANDAGGNPRVADLSPVVYRKLGGNPKSRTDPGVLKVRIEVASAPPSRPRTSRRGP